MLAMPAQAGTRDDAPATTVEETRPVRLLVPAERRAEYYLPYEDTLRASDLGITRKTTDRALAKLVGDDDEHRDITIAHLRRLRDALRIPRDVADARAWGFIVPEDENEQEFRADLSKRLGWFWVYDPTRTETRAEREARYLADERTIDMRGFARVMNRAYSSIKDWKFESDRWRRILDDPAHLEEQARTIASFNSRVTIRQAREAKLAEAQDAILTAMPARRDRAGQSDLWQVRDAAKCGRRRGGLDEWYERNTIKQTGRPKGSKTRPKVAAAVPARPGSGDATAE